MREYELYIPSKIKVGKKLYNINAQLFYSGIHHRVRMSIIEQIKDSLTKQIIMLKLYQPINKYPLTFEYYINANKKIYDLDNIGYIIIKIINDTLVNMKVIKDDNITCINKIIIHGEKNNKVNKNYIYIRLKINNN